MYFKKVLPVWIFLLAVLPAEAITYYSRVANGYWTDNGSWSTVTYGSPVNTGTYPKRGDVVMIGDGHRIIMDMNAVCASVTVGQGSSGMLEFSDYLSFTMTIAGTLTINPGAVVHYPGNLSRQHNLFISRHIVNEGVLDLYADSDDLVNVVFNSTVNSIISGGGIFDLNRVTLSKNTIAYTLEAQVLTFEDAIRNLVLTEGTFVHNNSGTYNMIPGFGAITIGSNAIVQVLQGTVHFVPDGDYLYLDGGLALDGGNVIVGSMAGNQGIRYRKNGSVTPNIDITAGTLEVRGGITYAATHPSSEFSFTMTGGDVILNTGTTGTGLPLFCVNDVAGSTFAMYNGNIILQKPNINPTVSTDFDICGSAGTVDVYSGNVEFGNSSTPSGSVFSFMPYPNAVQPNFRVTGSPAAAVTVNTAPGSTADFRLLSLFIDANKTFDIRSISGTQGDTKTMTLTYEMDGVNAFYNDGNFVARAGNVELQAAEGQWLSGNAMTVFYDFTVNNPFGIVLNSDMEVSNFLLMNSGIAYSSSVYPMILSETGSANIGNAASYVDGPVVKRVASVAPQNISLPVGKGNAYRPVILSVQHNSFASVSYTTEVWNNSAQALGFTLPPDIRWVSDIRYYTIQPSSTANLVSAMVTLSYGPDDIVNNFVTLRVGRDDGANGWINTGGIGTANGSGSITSDAFTSFNSYFTLANPDIGNNWLPVELTSFIGQRIGDCNQLSWTTASELNCDYFELQRSEDGINFTAIHQAAAAGTSSASQNYNFRDCQHPAISYYRLRIVDFDGTYSWSKVVTLRDKDRKTLLTYPNPSADGNFKIRVPDAGQWLLRVTDASGRSVIQSLTDFSGEKEFHQNLQPGVYMVQLLSSEGTDYTSRLVVADTP